MSLSRVSAADPFGDLLRRLLALSEQRWLRRAAGLLATLLVAAIFILGSYPVVVDRVVFMWDKAMHFSAYGVIATLLLLATRSWWLAGLLTPLIGAADEIHQIFVPGRSAGLDDWSADLLGTLAACLLARWLRRRALRNRP
ncbi:MAG: hypothetical protein RJA44_1033 [Pseudomonadota bacterium]